MQAYVFYTDNILDCIEVLQKSIDEIDDLEIVLVKGQSEHTSDLAGATHDPQYMKLMLTRWQKLPDIIRSNMGSNILFIDADIVFNKYQEDFVKNINLFLEDNDIVTQFDTNSGMSASINMGFLGIKCNDASLKLFSKFVELLLSIEKPTAGFPQTQFNDYLKFYNKNLLNFKVLPQNYGYLTTDCYFYHAVNCGGNQNKINAMNSALDRFKSNN